MRTDGSDDRWWIDESCRVCGRWVVKCTMRSPVVTSRVAWGLYYCLQNAISTPSPNYSHTYHRAWSVQTPYGKCMIYGEVTTYRSELQQDLHNCSCFFCCNYSLLCFDALSAATSLPYHRRQTVCLKTHGSIVWWLCYSKNINSTLLLTKMWAW